MARYAVFAGTYYYPSGGWEDFVGFADSIEEAGAKADIRDPYSFNADQSTLVHEWAHIVDLTEGKIVRHRRDSIGEENPNWKEGAAW